MCDNTSNDQSTCFCEDDEFFWSPYVYRSEFIREEEFSMGESPLSEKLHLPWRLGYYRGVTWGMLSAGLDEPLKGKDDPRWIWTPKRFPLKNYKGYDTEFQAEINRFIPYATVWAIVKDEESPFKEALRLACMKS